MQKEYRNFKLYWLVLVPVLFLTVLQFALLADAEMKSEKFLKSEKRCGVKGQNLIDAGDYEQAIGLLAKGIDEFPSSDWLIGLYGEALYLHGHLDEGEIQFRKALSMNKNNPVAKKYIEEIRKTQDLLEDRYVAEWIGIAKDKGADLLLLVLGVWIGTLLTLFSQKFMSWIKKANFEKAIRQGKYGSATDILETLVSEAKNSEVRANLTKLLSEVSLEEAEVILTDFVYDQEVEQKLLFVLRKINKQQRKAS